MICQWEIEVEYGHLVELTIHEIEMEESQTCEYDYLALANDIALNKTIMKICKSQHEKQVVTSEGHKMFLRLETDDSHSSKGFNLTYRSVMGDCGGQFTGSGATIMTPNFPKQNYEDKKICEWNIKTDPSHSIVFQFLDFDLESSTNCTKDFVEIYDPIFSKQLWKGCGNQMPNQTKFRSERNELLVRLISDDSISAKGFKGNFSDDCGARIVTNDTGEFVYRRSNDQYECTWTITAGDPAKKVVVTFTYINIFFETNEGCLSKIEVFDGNSDKGPLKTKFCGSKAPPAIFSNGNALTVKLNVSSLSYLSEFDIHYSVLDNGRFLV